MGELRGSADEPDHGDLPERHVPGAGGDAGAARACVEPRSRAEYAAELEQRSVSGWENRASAPIDAGRRFEPRRAGLPDISVDEAAAYIDARRGERPWLAVADGRPSQVQRVIASLDLGGGHGHIRHEGWVTEEMNKRRVAYLEDPAQPDPAKRSSGIDGLRPGNQPHQCRQAATRITNPDAFAAAFVRGIEHPNVRAALDTV